MPSCMCHNLCLGLWVRLSVSDLVDAQSQLRYLAYNTDNIELHSEFPSLLHFNRSIHVRSTTS